MLTLLKEAADGELEVWEPQFDSMPIKWVRGVNNTLRHIILQKSVAEILGCEPAFSVSAASRDSVTKVPA